MSEIQQAYAALMEVDRLLADIELKIKNIEQQSPVLEHNLATFRQLERVALRYLAIVNRMGLPENAQAVINTLSKLLVIIRMTQMALTTLAIPGPYGTVAGIAGLALSGIAASDFMMGLGE